MQRVATDVLAANTWQSGCSKKAAEAQPASASERSQAVRLPGQQKAEERPAIWSRTLHLRPLRKSFLCKDRKTRRGHPPTLGHSNQPGRPAPGAHS